MKKIISMFVWLVTTGLCWGQNVSRPKSYNYSRGVEAVQKEDFNESNGQSFLQKCFFSRLPFLNPGNKEI